MQFVMVVSKALADALRKGTEAPGTRRILSLIGDTPNARLRAMHEHPPDSSSTCYFLVDIRDPATAHRLVDSLRSVDGVETMYFKPSAELP